MDGGESEEDDFAKDGADDQSMSSSSSGRTQTPRAQTTPDGLPGSKKSS